VAPTILDACGITLTQGLPGHDQTPKLHAASLFQTLGGIDTWAEPVILQNIPQAAIGGSFFDERAVRTAGHKLILRKYDQSPAIRPGELYDLQADPDERVNLYPNQPQLTATLAKHLENWARATEDDTALELAQFAQRQ
jgi:arylsulfatase A-like enzyme